MSVASIIARGNSFYRSIPGEGEERRRKIGLMAKGQYLGNTLAQGFPGGGRDLDLRLRPRQRPDQPRRLQRHLQGVGWKLRAEAKA